MPSGCDPPSSIDDGRASQPIHLDSIGTRTTRRARDSTTNSASPSAVRQHPFGNAGTSEVHTTVSPPGRDAEQQPVVGRPVARVGHVQNSGVVERAEVGHPQRMLRGSARVGRRPRRSRTRTISPRPMSHPYTAPDPSTVTPIQEPAGVGDLLDRAVERDAVNLPCLSAGVHEPVGSPGRTLRMVEPFRDRRRTAQVSFLIESISASDRRRANPRRRSPRRSTRSAPAARPRGRSAPPRGSSPTGCAAAR